MSDAYHRLRSGPCAHSDLVAIENTIGSLHLVRRMDLYGEVTTMLYSTGTRFVFISKFLLSTSTSTAPYLGQFELNLIVNA
jgi:hypothetical protein